MLSGCGEYSPLSIPPLKVPYLPDRPTVMPSVAMPHWRTSCSAASISSVATPCLWNDPVMAIWWTSGMPRSWSPAKLDPENRDITNDIVTVHGDKAGALLVLRDRPDTSAPRVTIIYLLDEEMEGTLKFHSPKADDNSGNVLGPTLAYARRLTLIPQTGSGRVSSGLRSHAAAKDHADNVGMAPVPAGSAAATVVRKEAGMTLDAVS